MTWKLQLKQDADFWQDGILVVDDDTGVPVVFSSAELTLHPTNDQPSVIWNVGNGKLLLPTFSYKGNWLSTTSYVVGDVVTVDDEYYRALVNNTNVQPIVGTTWELFAQIKFLVLKAVISAYQWTEANTCLSVTYSNSMVDGSFQTGTAEIESAC